MAQQSSVHGSSREPLTWRPTKIMNMRDLSKDDDFLSHLLVEKLGTGSIPLLVHKMDSSRRLPKVSPHDLMEIVRRLVVFKGPAQHAVRTAVDELFFLAPIRYYLQNYTQKQINAFATHASRYFELYHPSGSIEISHTSRYSHRTGKSELCILATRNLAPGSVITELKGSMANLTDEEDRELKRTDLRNSDIRRDFSVIHSKSMKKNHLFLGPARFVNHDCDNNCELFREGRYITFRVLRPISIGEEITAHYGDCYFGRKNRHCLCDTCEKKGRGGYAPDHTDEEIPSDSAFSDSDSDDSDIESDATSSGPEDDADKRQVNLNERRTRRGVYAVVTKEEDQSDESDDEDGSVMPLAGASDIPSPGEMEMADSSSDLTSLPTSRAASNYNQAGPSCLSSSASELTPLSRSTSSLSSLSSSEGTVITSKSSSYQSIISTRRQKAQADAAVLVSAPATLQEDLLPSASSRHLSQLSASVTPSRGKGKQKEQSRSSSTPRRSDNSQVTGNGRAKDEDPRILRPRQSASVASEAVKEVSSKPEIPRGPDGKPLPICATCRNILPVISVDHQIVWGLGLEKDSRKKKAKQDCPRCMRHYAIYGEPWPRRVPLPGCASTFNTTPREETTPIEFARKVTPKVLPVLDRKIAAVASSKRKHSSEAPDAEDEVERLVKKPKTSVDRAITKKRIPIPLPEGQKRKRGRPRLMSVPITNHVSPMVVKVEDPEEALHPDGFKMQGRRMNGRFERKVSSSSPQKGYDPDSPQNALAGRAQRAFEREKTKQTLERELLVKRGLSEGEIERITKRGKWDDSDLHGKELPLKKVFPKISNSFRSGNLFSRPNPMSFAARAWANARVSDDGSSEDEKGPDTPEDSQSPPAILEVELGEWDRGPSLIVTAPAVPPAYKPSPFSFARRRWSSLSASPVEESRKSTSDVRPNVDARPPLNMERILGHNSSNMPLTLKDKPPSSYESWKPTQDVYSGDEDVRNLFTLRVTPFHEDDVNKRPMLLQHTYPSDVVYTQGPAFTPDLSFAPPNFIAPNFNDAGWESDLSDQ
ncbi:hypothetical protein J3R30DRAFT_3698073 [Lentinula aciculospora]|uniref:SET domain-containing protein n=1 Tax=Lentinula aciculospora TaxID=153920 RepID=A0A9W9AJK5_9AGAR|nr:hypothetical protein J3R30DRAFT_3698073 [Lentinula aciculospora]